MTDLEMKGVIIEELKRQHVSGELKEETGDCWLEGYFDIDKVVAAIRASKP